MPILGAHMSIAGGYYRAIERAVEVTCECVQVFTKNNNQWRAKALTEADCELWRSACKTAKFKHTLSHSSYLINLASPDRVLWKKSVDAMLVELERAGSLGIPYVVVHPGAFTTSSEAAGIRKIARALDAIHGSLPSDGAAVLLETTAGQGSCLGWRFEQLAAILDSVHDPDRVGFCFDTCHVFAAGYPMGTAQEYRDTMREFNRLVGVRKIKAFHLNDSQRELGSRVDRHDHIGRGRLGLAPFRFLLNDRRFARIPMYLETPKGEERGKAFDVINLKRLRRLVVKR